MQSFCQLEFDLMNVISRKQMMNLIYDAILNWRSMKSGEKGNYCLDLFLTAYRRFDFYVKIEFMAASRNCVKVFCPD